ncbi:MAG: zinc ribbon domain-containing protein [Deltaproteobacteria bacterium]|nr:zinc ribbon domain-containing protein [Deltaproteobacteria bacterium]MBW2351643.1 zinc ribbon domain-containing protein [Deltaproteobacteria bacterium]
MPIYEYECDECGHHLEALQKFSDPPLTECENCRSHKLKKLISHSTFHLKGTGWYVTDYASKYGSGGGGGHQRDTGGSKEKADSGKGAKGAAEGSNKKGTSAPSGKKE